MSKYVRKFRELGIKRLRNLLQTMQDKNVIDQKISVDIILDDLVRVVQGLPKRPIDRQIYSPLFGHGKDIEQYRMLALEVVSKKVIKESYVEADYIIDDLIRKLSNLPSRALTTLPYERLFKVIEDEKDVCEEKGNCSELISLEQLKEIASLAPVNVIEDVYLEFKEIIIRYDISTKERLAHFLSQVLHESGCFRYKEEIASGKAYEGRKDLGNINKGDGEKYKGAGWIQVTGRYWYSEFGKYIEDEKVIEMGVRYVAKRYAGSITGYWWMRNRMNEYIDKGESVRQITRRVNGGLNGLKDRQKYYERACKVLGI